MGQILNRAIVVVVGLILVLAGVFNWKPILRIGLYKDILGLTFYRIFFILIGLFVIILMIFAQ